jgi:hypothetical protein
MFTAEITGKEIINGSLHIYIRYTDGNHIVTQELVSYTPTQDWVDSEIKSKIENLEKMVSFEPEVPKGLWVKPQPKVVEVVEVPNPQ